MDINKAIPEQVHRLFAAALGLVAILLVYLSFSRTDNKSIKNLFQKFNICSFR